MPAIDVCAVSKTFGRGKRVLKDVSFSIENGEMVALIGASGSGKSTLIRALSGLIPADANGGEVSIFGQKLQANGRISSTAKNLRVRVAIVFQQFNLVPRLTLLTNVLLGRLGQMSRLRGSFGLFNEEEKKHAMHALKRVGIDRFALQRGSTLSGGQQQRGAIARALVQGADILIADEPIASLDPNSARKVMNILDKLNREEGITVLVSLHQVDYAIEYCQRTIALRDGELVYDGPSSALTPQFLDELYGAEAEELCGTVPASIGRDLVPAAARARANNVAAPATAFSN